MQLGFILPRNLHGNFFIRARRRFDRRAKMDVEAGEARGAVDGFVRHRRLDVVQIDHRGPAFGIGQRSPAVQEAGKCRAAPLVDLRQVRAAHIHVDTRRTPFERGGCIVPCGGAAAEHGDGFAAQRVEIDLVIGVRGKVGRQCAIDEVRPEVTTGAGTAGRQNDAPRQYFSTRSVFVQYGLYESAGRFERFQRNAVADGQRQHLLQPGQIFNPGPDYKSCKALPRHQGRISLHTRRER